jgi:hypothetical protein
MPDMRATLLRHISNPTAPWLGSLALCGIIACAPTPLVGTGRNCLEATPPDQTQFDLTPAARIVRGTIVDAHCAPITGAQVQLIPNGFPSDVIAQAASDTMGRFIIRAPDDRELGGNIRVRVAGFGPTIMSGVNSLVPDMSIGEIMMLRPARLSGRVTAPKGDPVRNAKVYVMWPFRTTKGEIRDRESPPPCDAVTDDRGAFSIDGLPAGTVTVGCESDGLADYVNDLVRLHEGDNSLEIRMHSAKTIRGVVLNSDGAPASGAAVSLSLDINESSFWRMAQMTAGTGTFEVANIPEDAARAYLCIELPGHQRNSMDLRDARSDLKVKLTRVPTVRVNSTCAGSSELPTIDWIAQDGDSFEGLFRIDSSVPGQCIGTLPSFCEPGALVELTPFTADHRSASKLTFNVPEAPSSEITLNAVFPHFGEIVGNVVLDSGAIVPGARVEYQDSSGWAPRVAYSDAMGQFRFDRVLPGSGALRCCGGDVVSDRIPIIVNSGETTQPPPIRAANACVIRGTVTIDGQLPRRSTLVAAHSFTSVKEHWRSDVSACVSTRPDGSFEIRGLPSGRYAIAANRQFDGSQTAIFELPVPQPWDSPNYPDDDWRDHWPWTVDASPDHTVRIDLRLLIACAESRSAR